MNFSNIKIEDLLPHRDKMKLVGNIIKIDEGDAVVETVITKNFPLVYDNNVNPIILIELIAQTAGISNGIERLTKYGINSEKKGWIVGIKKAVFYINEIPLNSKIITYAKNCFKYDSFREIQGKAIIDNITVCELTLQVFQPESKENP